MAVLFMYVLYVRKNDFGSKHKENYGNSQKKFKFLLNFVQNNGTI